MSGPSDKAIEAVDRWWADRDYSKFRADEALRAAHDPALGFDRSVCLRDVLEKLREFALTRDRRSQWPIDQAADFIEREFSPSTLEMEAPNACPNCGTVYTDDWICPNCNCVSPHAEAK